MRMSYKISLYSKHGELIRDVFNTSSTQALGEQLLDITDELLEGYLEAVDAETVDEYVLAIDEAKQAGKRLVITNVERKKPGLMSVQVTTSNMLQGSYRLTLYIEYSIAKLCDKLAEELAIGINASANN